MEMQVHQVIENGRTMWEVSNRERRNYFGTYSTRQEAEETAMVINGQMVR